MRKFKTYLLALFLVLLPMAYGVGVAQEVVPSPNNLVNATIKGITTILGTATQVPVLQWQSSDWVSCSAGSGLNIYVPATGNAVAPIIQSQGTGGCSGTTDLRIQPSFGRLQLSVGGNLVAIGNQFTNSGPGFKASGTTLAFRLGDDSADASISALTLSISSTSGSSILTSGGINISGASGFTVNGRSSLGSPSDGVSQLTNNAGTGFTRLILGTNDATANGIAIGNNAGNALITRGDGSSRVSVDAGTFLANGSLAIYGTTVTKYNNVNTAGLGVPAIYATANITAQSSNATITSYANGAADGDFEVSGQMSVTASTTLATTITCTYTDVSNVARTMILPVQTVTGTFVAAGAISGAGASIWETPVMHIRAKASTTITLLTSSGTFSGVTYSASGVIRQLQ